MTDATGVLLVLTGVRCYIAQDSVGDMLTYLRYVLCWISYEARRPLPASVHPRPASRDSSTRPAPDGSAKRPRRASRINSSRPGRRALVPEIRSVYSCSNELNRLNIEYVSFRENIDTGGPLGRAIVIIVGAVAELERNLIVERVRAGMRRARLEGRQIGRRPLDLDHAAIVRDRRNGQSLGQIAS